MDKSLFRQHCLKRLRHASTQNKRAKETLLQRELLDLVRVLHAKKVLLYWPLEMEVGTKKLLMALRKEVEVFLPFMVDVSFKMVPFRLPLERKTFGLYEPRDTLRIINKIDIAIVPVVGVDSDAKRIGFGKGMYDRFFAQLPTRPLIIFLQLSLCHSKRPLGDAHDIAADLIYTPRRCYRTMGTNHGLRNVLRDTRRGCHRHIKRRYRLSGRQKNNRI